MRPTLLFLFPALLLAQGRGGDQPSAPAPQPAKASAPIDLTGYWVSLVVDEWRFRVSPQKGDVPYLPLNAAARQIANTWDPDRDLADGKACKAYGAVGSVSTPTPARKPARSTSATVKGPKATPLGRATRLPNGCVPAAATPSPRVANLR